MNVSPVIHSPIARRMSLHALPAQAPATAASTGASPSTLPSDSYSRLAQAAKVYIFDDFTNAERSGVTTHGELVETELLRNQPGLSVARQQVSLDGNMDAIVQGQPGSLSQFMRGHFTTRLDHAGDAWAGLLENETGRAVVHQSQGASQSRAVEPLWGRAQRDLNFRNQVEQQLGMTASSQLEMSAQQKTALLGTLVERSEAIHGGDPAVQESIQELRLLQSESAERGQLHVISAGNQGALERQMTELGVAIPENFFRNEMVGPESIVVGAADDGTRLARSRGPAHTASIASPNAGAQIAADGVDRPMLVEGELQHHSGSSYAAPQVSSLVVDILRDDPTAGREDVLNRLRSEAQVVPGAEKYLGAGVVGYH